MKQNYLKNILIAIIKGGLGGSSELLFLKKKNVNYYVRNNISKYLSII